MNLIKSLALKVPQIRDIWHQREQAMSDRDHLRTQLDMTVASNEDLKVDFERLKDEITSLRATIEGVKTVQFCGRKIAIYGQPGDAYFDALNDHHTNAFFEFAASVVPQDAVCLDIGANIGLTAAALAAQARQVHSFEPSPSVYSFLERTLAANNANNVVKNRLAVGRDKGELRFFDDANSASASHLISDQTLARDAEVRVPVTTIDAYAKENDLARIDFIKIDIEGFEIDALKGGESTIRSLKPTALVEFNSFTMIGFRNVNPRDFLDYFRGLFPYVYKWSGSQPVLVGSDSEALTFLHDHLTGAGAVDDLMGRFTPLEA